MDEFIKMNYDKLKNICHKVSKMSDVDDLFHSCLEQFMNNVKSSGMPDKEKIYFFTRIVTNNFHSNTSKYHKDYRKHSFSEFHGYEIVDEEYFEGVDLDWVKDIISKWKTGDDWYWARLLELFIEEGGSITKLSIRTQIPKNSCSRDINKIRKKLKTLRDVQLQK